MTLEELKKSEAEFKVQGEDLKKSIATIAEKLQSKANGDETEDPNEDMKEMCDALGKYIDYVNDRVSRAFEYSYSLESKFYESNSEHRRGHLPSMSMSQMKKVLDKCGILEDFNLVPSQTVVTASNAKTFEIEWKIK
jgi:hypothetical protein